MAIYLNPAVRERPDFFVVIAFIKSAAAGTIAWLALTPYLSQTLECSFARRPFKQYLDTDQRFRNYFYISSGTI